MKAPMSVPSSAEMTVHVPTTLEIRVSSPPSSAASIPAALPNATSSSACTTAHWLEAAGVQV
jgi:hypothetical protein